MKYEDLYGSTAATLRRVLEFTGVTDVDDSLLVATVDFGSFENMRRLEDSNAYDNRMLQPETKGDYRSYKTRKGVIGDHKNLFDAENRAYVERLINTRLNPEFGYSKSSAP